MTRPIFSLTLVILLNCAWSVSFAQIPAPEYGIAGKPFSEANECHTDWSCGGDTEFENPGIYDIEVYGAENRDVDGFRFSLDYPEEWTVIDFETCGWSITAGDPFAPELGLELIGDRCYFREGPILRLTVNCATPGRASLWPIPGDDLAQQRLCGGEWIDAWDFYQTPINIGDFCGRLTTGPCNYCEVRLAGYAVPSSFEVQVAPDGLVSREVRIVGDREPTRCAQWPECTSAIQPDRSCLGSIESQVPWATPQYIRSVGRDHYYDVEFDATGLSPGEYTGRASIHPAQCPYCKSSCFSFTMVVLEPAAVENPLGASRELRVWSRGNPSTSEGVSYSFSLPKETNIRVDLLDVQGRLIGQSMERGLPAGTHDRTLVPQRSGIRGGIYLLRVRTDKSEATCKVTITSR